MMSIYKVIFLSKIAYVIYFVSGLMLLGLHINQYINQNDYSMCITANGIGGFSKADEAKKCEVLFTERKTFRSTTDDYNAFYSPKYCPADRSMYFDLYKQVISIDPEFKRKVIDFDDWWKKLPVREPQNSDCKG